MHLFRKIYYLFLTAKPGHHFATELSFIVGFFYASAGRLPTNQELLLLITFVIFYGAIYQMNEVLDYERDRKDPYRNRRPLASGKVSRGEVLATAIVLGGSAFSFMVVNRPTLLLLLCGLILLNILYTRILKNYRYIDLLIINMSHMVKFWCGIIIANQTLSFNFEILLLSFCIYFIVLTLQPNRRIFALLDKPDRRPELNAYLIIRRSSLLFLTLILFSAKLYSFTFLVIAYVFLVIFIALLEFSKPFKLWFRSQQTWYSKY